MNHLDRYNILYPMWHGIRGKRLCKTQLLEIEDDSTRDMTDKKQTEVLIMDFSKILTKAATAIHKLSAVLTHKISNGLSTSETYVAKRIGPSDS